MGAPVGNTNNSGSKLWRAAILRALEKRNKSRIEGKQALDELAEKFLETCDEKELAAFRELGDRLDGKAVATIEGTGPNGAIVVITSKDDESVL